MLFGHNSNVQVGDASFHVQTEDRGVSSALIDTTVYFGGRVLHRRTNHYHDLIPLDPDREQALRLRLDEQHRTTLEDIRTGALHLVPPPPIAPRRAALPTADPVAASPPGPAGAAVPSIPVSDVLQGRGPEAEANGATPPPAPILGPDPATALQLELRNPRNWLSGKQARLEITVRAASGEPEPGAEVTVLVEGAAIPENFHAATNAQGQAEIRFTMPRLLTGEAALVIKALQHQSTIPSSKTPRAVLRFALRTKPRVS